MRTAGWAVSTRAAGRQRERPATLVARRATGAPPKPRAAYGKRARPARRRLAADWRVMDGVVKIARRIWEVGVSGSPVIGRQRGAFSTLLRRPGLRAFSDGVLATKSERKMLASTCLYSLYAWLLSVFTRRLYAVPVRLSDHRLHYDGAQDDSAQDQARHLGEP